jgi:UDPglucose 6-dehydrogenase
MLNVQPKKTVSIGIVGFGFVGKALYYGLNDRLTYANFYIHDPYMKDDFYGKQADCSIGKVGFNSDFIFLCLPTPTDFEEYKQDLSIIDSVIKKLAPYVENQDKLVIIKSTVAPGTTAEYQKRYPKINFAFNPEFLTEANYLGDFLGQDRIVLGGNAIKPLEQLYRYGWPDAQYFLMSSTEAELVKYTANAFLSTKVAFFNEIFQLAKALKIDYDVVREAVTSDKRIGESHSIVPGFDGEFGFGGKCFPKDLVTLIGLLSGKRITSDVIRATWETNLLRRKEHDWKDIKGATTENLHGD